MDQGIISIVVDFLVAWSAGFFGSLILVLPFVSVKQILDVASVSASEIRGA